MSEPKALRLDEFGGADPSELTDAIDLASDQDQPTWIEDADGKRVAAVVPVEVLEKYQEAMDSVLRPSFSSARLRGRIEL